MANAFDRFDAQRSKTPEPTGNPFDAFDEVAETEALSQYGPSKSSNAGRSFPKPERTPGKGLQPPENYDSFVEATGKSLSNVPERLQQSFGGLVQMLGEDMGQSREQFVQQSANRLGITPQEYKLMAWAGNEGLVDPETSIPEALKSLKSRMLTELSPEQQAQVADMGLINPETVAAKGREFRADAQSTMKPVNAEPGSPEYYASAAIGSIAEMTPALIASALTRNPAVGMTIIGGQVGGESYGTVRDKGLSVDESQRYAFAQAAAEAIPEYLPIAKILKPGANFFKKVFDTAIAESLQEGVTAALQAGIDKDTIRPDMTWGEARGLISDSMIIGSIAGPGMVAITEPLVRYRNRQSPEGQDPESAPPVLTETLTQPAPDADISAFGLDVTPSEANPFDVFDQRASTPEATAEVGAGDGHPVGRNVQATEPSSEPQSQEQPESSEPALSEKGTGVFRVPVDQIKVDPQQYQFRSRVNEQGVDQRLSGVKKWDDRRSGSVLLHRRENGDLYVADGHHRVDLAKKLGQGKINAQIINEADGVTVEQARVEAAMNNIADGKAEPLDVAKVFRGSEVPANEIRSTYDLPSNQVVRDGESLSNLSDNVFGMVAAGQMTEKDGAAIGAAFTEQAQQEAAAEAFQKVQPNTEYQRQLLINEIRAAEFAQAQGEQGGLFGDDPQEVSLMQDRLKVLDSLRQRLNSDKRLFKSLNDNADRAGEAGNQIATEANESITQQSARSLDLIGRVTTTPALNEMVNRAARRVYDGESRSKVVTELKQELMSYEQGADAKISGERSQAQSRKPAAESGQEPRESESVPEPDTTGADQGGQPESEVTPSLDLETQTEEQLAEQARAREEAEQAKTEQRKQAEQRAQADEQVDEFALTGSERTADVAMAAGQEDLLSQPDSETDTNPTEGQKGSDRPDNREVAPEDEGRGRDNSRTEDAEGGEEVSAASEAENLTAGQPARSGYRKIKDILPESLAESFPSHLMRNKGSSEPHERMFPFDTYSSFDAIVEQTGQEHPSYLNYKPDEVQPDGTIYTPENLIHVLKGLESGVKDMNGKLNAGKQQYGDGAPTPKKLLDTWIRLKQTENTVANSRANYPDAWAIYDRRQKDLQKLKKGDKVHRPYSSPESPYGTIGKIIRKGPKNWRVSQSPGSPHSSLIPIEALAPEGAFESEPQGQQKTEQQEVAQPADPVNRDSVISDFGEKIEGARKDYASKMKAAKEKDVAAVPLSESWPEPNYEKLIESGADPVAIGFAHAARDEVPPKPRKGWKLKGWTTQVETLRSVSESIIDGSVSMDDVRNLAEQKEFSAVSSYVMGRAELYAEVGHSKSLKGLRFHKADFALWNGEKDVTKWLIEKNQKATAFDNMPSQLVEADTKEEAIKKFRKVHESLGEKGKTDKKVRFDIYSDRRDKTDIFIGKKIGKDVVRIKEGFDSVKEAREYLNAKQDVLERILDKMKNIPDHRKATNSPRVGVDHRNGGDVTPEAFAEAFNFRGVQFGNFVEQGRRQQDLNEAYDGLMDLAGILNVPAKALSLNGELGLAFGARGKGGKNAPKAHYESGSVVINLTKKAGAGSLAHEWFHALDNYFARPRGSESSARRYATDGNPDIAVRPEVIDAFRNIRQTVNRIRMRERSQKLDKVRTKAYWSTDVEMTARAFESYVIEKLKDQEGANDYLANIVSEEYWEASEALGMEDSDSYPYPEAAEIPEIRAAYDNLFSVIETVEQPNGAIMVREQNGVPYYQVREDQISLDFDAEPENDGQASNLPSGQRGADNAATEATDTGRRSPRIQNQRQRARQIERQSFFHGLREVTNAAEAAHVLAPFRKDAHETMLALVMDEDRRPLAIIRHTKGTVDGTAVYPERFISDMVSVPGADSVWLSHNHPSGTMSPSGSDIKITQKLAPMIKNADLKLEGHVIIGFGRDHTAFDVSDRSDGGLSITEAAVRKHKIPVLERQIASKTGMKNAKPIKSPDDAVKALKDIADKDQTGVMLLDNANRPLGFLDLSGYDLEALRGTSAYRDVLQAIASTNASSGIVQAGSGVRDTQNLQRMLADTGEFRLLDAVHVDIMFERDVDYGSAANMGALETSGAWFSLDGEYLRTKNKRTDALSATEARTHASTLMRDWKGRPPVMIADSISEFPQRLRAAIRKAGAESDMRGVYFEGKVYILASRIPSRAALEEVVLHEVVGHYGLRTMMGAELKPLLNQVYLKFARTDQAKKLIRNYFPKGNFSASNSNHRLTIAEELLAHLAETGKHQKLWNKIVAAVREGLRKLGFTLEMTEADLLGILAGAQKTVEQGGISRPSEADNHFRRAYHGTPHRFDKFSLEAIGTGEGVQAFGWGIYLASRRSIAEYYQESVSNVSGGGLSLAGVVPASANEGLSNGAWVAAKDLSELLVPNPKNVKLFGDLDIKGQRRVLSMMRAILQDREVLDSVVSLVPIDMVNMLGGQKLSAQALLNNPAMLIDLLPANPDNLVASSISAMDILAPAVALSAAKIHTGLGRFDVAASDFVSAGGTVNHGSLRDVYGKIPHPSEFRKGNLYEVEIPDDRDLLDYDKRLNDQPPGITDAVRAITDEQHGEGTFDYWMEANEEGGDYREWRDNLMEEVEDRDLSLALNEKGVPGLRYLDGDSRIDAANGATHNYVIWDESVVSVQAVNDEMAQAEAYFSRSGQKQTDTEAFRKWFGASKVVDESGEPLVVYHGTGQDVAAFDKTAIGEETDFGIFGQGFYTISDPELASFYAARAGRKRHSGPNVMPVYIKAESPLWVKEAGRDTETSFERIEHLIDAFKVEHPDADRRLYPILERGNLSEDFIEGDDQSISEQVSELIEDFEFDSVIYEFDDGTKEVVVFEPTQIKSATGNSGTFEPDNADIRFSRSTAPALDPQPFGPPSDTLIRRLVSKIADKHTVLKGVQKNIQEQFGEIPEPANAYRAEELFHGKVENDIRLIQENMVEPLAKAMSENDVSLKQLDEFLYALHAPERNRAIAERNPEIPEGGSGMTDAEAAAIINKVEKSGKLKQYRDLAKRVHDMLAMRRKILKSAGLLDEETVGAWEASYKNYVPLKGWAADERQSDTPRIGKGFAIAGKESQMAAGRKSRAASPLANTISDLSEAVLRRRKNQVGNAFMNLVEAYPNGSYWQVYTDENPEAQRKAVRVKDPATGKMKVKVREQTVPMAMMSDRYFTTKRDGKTYYIKIEDERLMNAMRNIGPDNSSLLVRSLSAVTRVMSSLNTSYNPEFIISNFSRDIQTALLNLTSEQSSEDGKARGKKIAAKTLKDVGTSIRAINASLKGKKLTGKAGEWQAHFDQFRADGAKTGWFDMKDIDGQMQDLEKMIAVAGGGPVNSVRRAFRATTDWVENTNSAIENGVRLSAYVNAIEAGISRSQAASLAKNMTVNFNRKGELGTMINALYMFANASVQGTANFVRTLGRLNGVKGDPAWQRMHTAQKIAVGMAVGGFMLSLLNRLVAGEDDDEVNWWDKVPDYVKERNIVIMKSLAGGEPGEYWTIPLPYGYNIFPVIGTQIEHIAFSENQSSGDAASNVVLAALGSFSPIGFEQSEELYGVLAKNIMPTILRPVASISLNENFMGGPIYKENFPFGTQKPDSALYFRSTPEAFKALAEGLNDATGGSEFRSGAADLSPDVMQFLVGYYGGGAYNFFTSRTPNFLQKVATGVELEDREIPFVRKVSGKVLPYEDQSKFYDRRNEIQQLVAERKALKGRERIEFSKDYRDKLRLKPIIDSTEKRLKMLREQRDRIELMDLSASEEDRRLQQVERQMKRAINQFNKRYNEADD